MAKDIERRAVKYATHQTTPWDAPVIDQVAREHYALGATEQRKIDIEKACKEFLHFLNIRVDNKNYQLRREDFTNWVNDFRKAMEE